MMSEFQREQLPELERERERENRFFEESSEENKTKQFEGLCCASRAV